MTTRKNVRRLRRGRFAPQAEAPTWCEACDRHERDHEARTGRCPSKVAVTVVLSAEAYALLDATAKHAAVKFTDGAELLATLAHHAVDGVRRPGAWERSWLISVVGGLDEVPVEVDLTAPWRRVLRKPEPSRG